MFALFEAGSQVVGACPTPRFGYASRGANRVAPLRGAASRGANRVAPLRGAASRGANRVAPLRGAASPGANRVAPLRGAVATWVIPGTTSERLNMVSPMQGAKRRSMGFRSGGVSLKSGLEEGEHGRDAGLRT